MHLSNFNGANVTYFLEESVSMNEQRVGIFEQSLFLNKKERLVILL